MNLSNPPLVSIIVPCYNYGHLLSETLNNIIEQSYTHWECIIVDDGSTDNTSSVAKEFVNGHEQFSYVFQKNAGLSAARNTGIHHSKGSFIQLLDADDFIESNKLLSQINVFIEHPNSEIVYSEVRYFSSEQKSLRRFSMSEIDKPWMPKVDSSNQQLLMSTLIDLNICVVNAPLIRKSVFDKIGLFNTKLIAVEDWEFWCRCAFQNVNFRFNNSLGTQALVRFHEGSMSKNMKRMFEAACVARNTIEHLIQKMNSQEDSSQLFKRNRQERIFLHKSLFEIYRDYLKDEIKASIHQEQLNKSMKGERIICTEAIHQDQAKVLAFVQTLGYPIYANVNSKEQAANLFQDAGWLEEVGDQIVFIPSHSLSFLPDHFHYKLLYVQSELNFSPKNQKGEDMSTVLSTKKLMHFEQEQTKIEAWMESQADLSVLYLNYSEIEQNKEEQGFIIDNFLKK